jgi:uncharacterized protein
MTIIEAIQQGDLTALKLAIAENPTCVNDRDPSGIPALLLALYYRRTDCVHRLLDAGAEVDYHLACALNRSEDAARFLDANPALVSQQTPDGWTGLHLAAFFGAAETARLLLSRGADPSLRSGNQMANLPIHSAAASRQAGIVEMLLAAGSPADDRQHGGYTPMDAALQNNDQATIDVLLRHGAKPPVK